MIDSKIAECIWHEPSLLAFDDLDIWVPVEMEQVDSSRTRQITGILIRALNRLSNFSSKLAIIATASDKTSLNESFISRHVFDHFVKIIPANIKERTEVFNYMDINQFKLSLIVFR